MILLIIQLIVGSIFLMVGFVKLLMSRHQLRTKLGPWVDDFNSQQIRIIGVFEILGSLLLLKILLFNNYQVLEILGISVLCAVMAGATRTHWKRRESFVHTIILLAILIVLFVSKIANS
ncbi:MAG: DoxX family protein [Cyclobacteriaceae bacterium]